MLFSVLNIVGLVLSNYFNSSGLINTAKVSFSILFVMDIVVAYWSLKDNFREYGIFFLAIQFLP